MARVIKNYFLGFLIELLVVNKFRLWGYKKYQSNLFSSRHLVALSLQ